MVLDKAVTKALPMAFVSQDHSAPEARYSRFFFGGGSECCGDVMLTGRSATVLRGRSVGENEVSA